MTLDKDFQDGKTALLASKYAKSVKLFSFPQLH
jgi:hypothetical protein